MEKLQDDARTQLQKALSSADINNKIASMNAKQRKDFEAAAINFTIGALKDKQLASSSSSLVSGVTANPTLIVRLPDLKDVVSSVTSQAKFGLDRYEPSQACNFGQDQGTSDIG